MELKLTYFKRTGKFYSSEVYQSNTEVRTQLRIEMNFLHKENRLPGLTHHNNGKPSEFTVLVEGQDQYGDFKFIVIGEKE